MSRKQRIIISITGIFLVLMILVGLTYAYFLTKITGNTNTKSISVSTANLQILYGDNSAEILGKDLVLEPSSNEIGTKTFTVTNEGNSETSYVVVIENVSITKSTDGTTTTFESNDFRYTLDCVKKDGSSCDGVSTQSVFPINGGILVSNSIDVSDVQTYTFKMWYIDTGIDQSNDMGKTLQAKINITNIESINPYSSNKNSLAYNIIESAKNKTNGTELLAVPKVKPGEGISEYKTGKIIKETVTTSSLCSGYAPWLVGDSESAAKFGSSVSSYDEAVGKYVYDQCSYWTKKLLSYDSTNNTLTFEKDEIKTESTLSTAQDDYGTTYYYRGAVTDNYVTFADKLWRIVRINGDGTVKLVLDDVAKDTSGTVIETAFNSSYNDNAYVGYMYGTVGSTAYDDTHKNINDSTIKTKVDAWYKANIVDTNNADYVAETLFCNDKTLALNGIGGVTNQLGYGKNITYYASIERLQYSTGTTSITTSKPTFKCAESTTNDYSRFTVNVGTLSNGNKTNGNLTYPVGLLTADEVAYAGAYKFGQTNKTYYLYNSSISSSWWLSSPYSFAGSYESEWSVYYSTGALYSNGVNYPYAFRPSINLKAETLKNAGDGTKENPYTVKLST